MKGEKIIFYSLCGVLFFFPVLFIFQGLEFVDIGYNIVVARDMVNDPANVSAGNYASFLSMFLYGLWLNISASWGILGAKLGMVFVYWLIFWATFRALSTFIPGNRLLLFILMTFMLPQRIYWVVYNDFTALFVVIASFALFHGFLHRVRWMCCISGMFCGLAFFARFPNILMVFMGGLPILVSLSFSSRFSLKSAMKDLAGFLVGFTGACVLTLFFLYMTGYLEYFLSGYAELKDMARSSSMYSLASLMKLFLVDHGKVFGATLPLAFLGAWVASKIAVVSESKRLLLLMLCFSLFAAWGTILYDRSHFLRIVIGFVYFFLSMRIWDYWKEKKSEDFFISLLALFMLLTVPLGSGRGVYNAVYGLWFAFPLFLNDLLRIKDPSFLFKGVSVFEGDESSAAFWFKRVAFTGIVIVSLISTYRYTYCESPYRTEMRYSINHPKLRGIFTTEAQAKAVQEVLDELSFYVCPGDFLLGYNHVTTLYYLTETRPYLYNPWPLLVFQGATLTHYLARAERERPEPPVVVRRKKGQHYGGGNYVSETNSVLDEFVERKQYHKVWENNVYEILTPTL